MSDDASAGCVSGLGASLAQVLRVEVTVEVYLRKLVCMHAVMVAVTVTATHVQLRNCTREIYFQGSTDAVAVCPTVLHTPRFTYKVMRSYTSRYLKAWHFSR